ncbi:MAG: PLP-dependent transferase, partial [Luminiphilus sp.]
TTHGRLSAQQRELSGIAPGLVRIAVGLEHLEDIKADCERGFSALAV